jgi:uncharacterized protein (TIGR02246 family)
LNSNNDSNWNQENEVPVIPAKYQREMTKMLRNGCTIGGLIFVMLFASCANPPAPAPVADTREVDIQAVRDVEAAYLKDLADRNAEKYFAHFADDASGLYPGTPICDGKNAIRAWVEPMFADPGFSFVIKSSRIETSKGGDVAYSTGTYVMTVTDANTKKVRTEKGKYLTIFRKQEDGSWKVAADAAVADPAM